MRRGIATSEADAHLEVASRTDRGVSARANALALRSDLSGPNLLRSLNGLSPELFFTAAVRLADDARVRSAVRRVYRYYEAATAPDLARWRGAARRFVGTVDARSFGRGLGAGAPVWRDVESVTVDPVDGGLQIEVRAPSFVWGMVRKIVAALREHDAGRLPLARLEGALRGRERLTLPLAEPEPLVLYEVEYPFPWTVRWRGPTRHQVRYLDSIRSGLWQRSRVLRDLEPGPPSAEAGGGL